MGRAAMMAFAAASLGVASCGGETASRSEGPPLTDAATDSAHAIGNGGANVGTGGTNVGTGGDMPIVFYGAAMPPTGGTSGAGGSTGGAPNAGGTNAGTGGDMGIPIYGAAPIPNKP